MNKRTLSSLISLSIVSSSFALSNAYKPVRLEVGATVPISINDTIGIGVGFLVEPKVNITDQFSAGVRFEVGQIGQSGTDGTVHFDWFTSCLAKGEYFFNRKEVRPFASLGAGLFKYNGSHFGVTPQLGLNIKGVRIATGMNLIFDGKGDNFVIAETNDVGEVTLIPNDDKEILPVLSIEVSGSFGWDKRRR